MKSSLEVRSDAVLADLVDSASRSLHQASQRHKPSAQLLVEGLSPGDRQETLIWLVQAFEVMHFHDSLLFDTSLLLDRYYAFLPEKDARTGSSQRKLLAAVCMALKIGCSWDTQLPLRQVVTHLGRNEVPFDEVLIAELAMLQKLRFDVGTPTAHDFLEALSTRLVAVFQMSEASLKLAEFLLQLTLGDAHLHYRFPHAVLAASALVLALCTLRAAPAAHMALLEDLALHCPDAAAPNGLLSQCVGAVNVCWLRSVSCNEQSLYAFHLCQKFSRMSNHAVATVAPPVLPPTTIPAVHGLSPFACWKQSSQSQSSQSEDEVDEAVRVVHHSLLDSAGVPSDHGEAQECLQLSRCPRCGHVWKFPEPFGGMCTECGCAVELNSHSTDLRDQQQWSAMLSTRLRGPAETNWKVKSVLVRHSWTNGRFRHAPDREHLLRDLIRVSKRSEKPQAVQSAKAGNAANAQELISARRRSASLSSSSRPSRPQALQALQAPQAPRARSP